MRSYEGTIEQSLLDIRKDEFSYLHDPINYSSSQEFGRKIREEKAWGLIYNSVRHPKGQCIAAFKPRAISIPKPLAHLRYVWNGKQITEVFDATLVMKLQRTNEYGT